MKIIRALLLGKEGNQLSIDVEVEGIVYDGILTRRVLR